MLYIKGRFIGFDCLREEDNKMSGTLSNSSESCEGRLVEFA